MITISNWQTKKWDIFHTLVRYQVFLIDPLTEDCLWENILCLSPINEHDKTFTSGKIYPIILSGQCICHIILASIELPNLSKYKKENMNINGKGNVKSCNI